MTTDEMLAEILDWKPTPCRKWTFWDHFIHKTTGRVSRRVYEDRMLNMALDDARLARLHTRASDKEDR